LLGQESAEQLERLRKAHGQLLEDYNGLARMGRELELKRSSRDEEETVGLALLRDKLEARERQLELQVRGGTGRGEGAHSRVCSAETNTRIGTTNLAVRNEQ
jgi:hypothetical protein